MDNLICSELGQGVEILQEILYNICMNTKHRGFLMAETARKRFNISEKSSTKCRVGKTDFRTDCAKRALNVVKIDKQNTGLIHVTNLFPYFLNPLFPLPKWQYVQNPCPIRLSAGGGGG